MTGADLIATREEYGLTQERLAEMLGIELSELRGWEALGQAEAGGTHATLLDLAINQLEAELWIPERGDSDFKALQDRINKAIGPPSAVISTNAD